MGFYYYGSGTRDVKGGIKAQNRRGRFGSSWWGRRWEELLDDFDMGERLTRGKRYARRGQVTDLKIKKGMVQAAVQGSDWEPYKVKISFKKMGGAGWKRVATATMARPAIASRLLAGQLPEEMEDIFEEAGLSLLPQGGSDIDTDCSCYDWANPCKHIAAVYLLLCEEFDRDPFLAFKLRGMDRQEFLNMIGLQPISVDNFKESDEEAGKPLPTNVAEFWGRDHTPVDIGGVHIPDIIAALPKHLGGFPFWRGSEDFMENMERIYASASNMGMGALLGEEDSKKRVRG